MFILKTSLVACSLHNVIMLARILYYQVLTRDFKPVKPDPAPLFHIAKRWETEPKNLIMVGDDKNDIQCGKAAGAGIFPSYYLLYFYLFILIWLLSLTLQVFFSQRN